MIDRLMDGELIAARELARAAGVAASTASEHLAELERGGLVMCAKQGRNRYFAIASSEVATALESLAQIFPPTPVRSLRQSREAERVAFFRTCYDHVAGFVAVAMLERMVRERWLIPGSAGGLDRGFFVTFPTKTLLYDDSIEKIEPTRSGCPPVLRLLLALSAA